MSSSSGGFWPGEAPAGDEHEDHDVEELETDPVGAEDVALAETEPESEAATEPEVESEPAPESSTAPPSAIPSATSHR